MDKTRIQTINQAVREKLEPELFNKWMCGEDDLTHKEWDKINNACCFAYNELANRLENMEEANS